MDVLVCIFLHYTVFPVPTYLATTVLHHIVVVVVVAVSVAVR